MTGMLVVSPGDGIESSGPDKNCHFNPKAKTYHIKNPGESSIDYTVSKDKTWISVSGSSGTLEPGASTRIVVSLNDTIKGLKGDGPHLGKVTFTNATNGKGTTTRAVKVLQEQHWLVTYSGYQIFYIGDTRQAGGVKLHWKTIVRFVVDNEKYKEGRGRNSIHKVESYSHPPGVWNCVTLAGYPKIRLEKFTVPGNKLGHTVRLRLPADKNSYLTGFTCLMDTDALKRYYDRKGYKTYPSLEGIDKTKTAKSLRGVFPRGPHEVSLSNYTKTIEGDVFQGLELTVRRLESPCKK
jgi:hypothetical protein